MTKRIFIILILIVSLFCIFLNKPCLFNESTWLNELLTPLYLNQEDLKIKFISIDKNEFLLEKVIGFLANPLSIPRYTSSLASNLFNFSSSLEKEIKEAALNLEIGYDYDPKSKIVNEDYLKLIQEINDKIKDPRTRKAVSNLIRAIFEANNKLKFAFSKLSDKEMDLLYNHLCLALLEDYKRPEGLSKWELQWFTEDLFLIAKKVDLEEIIEAGILVARAVDYYNRVSEITFPRILQKDDIILELDSSCGKIIIGGYGDNEYHLESPALIIDPGANDRYFVNNSLKKQVSIIIDHSGDDVYTSLEEDFSQGCGNFGISILVDKKGNDIYQGNNFSQGCGVFGIGILQDEQGNDIYSGDTMVQGAATFGIGLLIDLKGDDRYSGALMTQGFGYTKGLGGIVELDGNDMYQSGNKYLDYRESEGAFRSFSQGFGFGCRNYAGGGIGILADYRGNDDYTGNYFAQGSSYWFSLGILYDREGRDTYDARRYAQGAGIHLSVGSLLDCSGDDRYTSWGVSQGCGHDFSQGILVDMKGNDEYISDWLSEGAGSQSGVGILIDLQGDDSYKGQSNIQGIGSYDELRDLNSLGLLFDLKGKDAYSPERPENSFWYAGSYGGGIDTSKGKMRFIPLEIPIYSRITKFLMGFTKVWGNNYIDNRLFKEKARPEDRRLPTLVPELEKDIINDEMKKEIAEALSAKGPQIVESLVGYIDIKDTYTTRTIEETLKAIGEPAALNLCTMLRGQDLKRSKAYSILYVLGDIKDEDSFEVFVWNLSHADPRIRLMSARGIKNLETKPPFEKITPLFKEKSPRIRKYAAEIIGKYKTKEARNLLRRLLKDNNFNVRFAAADTLKKMDE
jgi:hypothetical protein